MVESNKVGFTNDFSHEIWASTYKDHKDNTLQDTFKRVARALASVENTEQKKLEWEEKFFDLLNEFKATCGGRIYSNAGTSWGGTTLVNCFVGPMPEYDIDSLDGILNILRNQAQTLKSEGGWGFNFSFIRPRGAFIHGIGVETPGSVKYMELFDKSSDIITAGSGKKSKNKKAKGKIRKGAMMGILDCWHPDVEEFITAKQQENRLSKFNVSVNCSNEFMDRLLKVKELKQNNASDDEIKKYDTWDLVFPDTTFEKYKQEWNGNIQLWKQKGYPIIVYKTISITYLWGLITRSTYNRNEPGVLFLDIANKTHCWNYGEKSFIASTNPCQPFWATVLTKKGVSTIGELKIGDDIWSEKGWTKVVNKWSGGIKEVFEYKTPFGCFYGTENHKILENGEKVEVKNAESIDLLRGKTPESVIFDSQVIMDGIVIGDGMVHKTSSSKVFLCIGENDRDYFDSEIKDLICQHRTGVNPYAYEVKTNIRSGELDRTFVRKIPQRYFYGDKNVVCSFLRGLYSANGSVCDGRVILKACSLDLINQTQIMLSSIGIASYITTNKPKNVQFSNGEHLCKQSYNLNITRDRAKFKEFVGFIQKHKNEKLDLFIDKMTISLKNEIVSKNIIEINKISEEEVFDITVDNETHTYWTGGLNVSNCGEQLLPYSGICNLGSINLTQFINSDYSDFDYEKLKKYTKYLVRFLDNVNDYTRVPLPEYEDFIKTKRRIGLGLLGWASSLYLLKVRFASDKAEQLKEKLMKTICYNAIEESINLAEEKGAFPDCDFQKHADSYFFKQINLPNYLVEKIKKVGIRNSSIFSIQPTGNTSILANIVSGGLEPIFMHEYIRTSIVPNIPDHIKDVCPKYQEGEFKETKMFKFHKEGDETILKGVDDNGTIYKIDKNRGLTKETLCEDYAVKILKQKNEWDVNADWAVTTTNLSVDEHIRDMSGFAKWIDSSISKTINIPADYPFEKFENVYLEAYKTGYIKGITTYRAGTMTSVLSENKKEEDTKQGDKIHKTNSPKRPKDLKADVSHLTIKGHRYYCVVGLLNNDPYEVFTGSNHDHEGEIIIPKNIKNGIVRKNSRGNYSLIVDEKEYHLTNGHNDSNADALTRMISFGLRHGGDIAFAVHQLQKTNGGWHEFSKVLARALKKYIPDGARVEGEKCPSCGSDKLFRSEGCVKCECGWAKCS